MLLQFKVSNYMSIKDEIVLSAVASIAGEHEENNMNFGKERILPSLAIFGANAVGKSNIFKALTAAILFVRGSNLMQVNTNIATVPFMLDDSSRNEPTKMDFLFVNNGKKFNYGFEITQHRVVQEYLYEYLSSRPSMIFERNDETYNFTTQNNKELEEYVNKNTPNKLFLCTATAWNCQLTKDAYLWFSESIDTYDSQRLKSIERLAYLDNNKDNPEIKEFINRLLKNTDRSITNHIINSRKTGGINFVLPPGFTIDKNVMDQIKMNSKEYSLSAIHEVEDINGFKRTYPIDFAAESNGTQIMFFYAPIIHDALKKGRTIVIDEFDNNLHPNLKKSIIRLFSDRSMNKERAQLIFNSHDMDLLDSDLFRRDQIYFVEKGKDGQTKLNILQDYKVRRNDNFRKGYFDGKYSKLPETNNLSD